MSGFGFGWRVGLCTMVVLSLVSIVLGWVLTQFDGQYDAGGVPGRLVVGLFVGVGAAGVLLPVTATIAVVVGLGAGVWHGHRRRAQT